MQEAGRRQERKTGRRQIGRKREAEKRKRCEPGEGLGKRDKRPSEE